MSIMNEIMPDKIISKALWEDSDYFKPIYNGKRLCDNLSYGWEMTYGGDPKFKLQPYADLVKFNDKGVDKAISMGKNKLLLGFYYNEMHRDPKESAHWIKENGYAGVMVFNFEDEKNVKIMENLVNVLLYTGHFTTLDQG